VGQSPAVTCPSGAAAAAACGAAAAAAVAVSAWATASEPAPATAAHAAKSPEAATARKAFLLMRCNLIRCVVSGEPGGFR
jgi:hypothetical protein